MPLSDPSLIYDDIGTAEEILVALAQLIPGWQPSETHIETAQAEAHALALSTAMIEFRERLREAYANGFGRNVLGIDRDPPAAARTTATWTFTTTDPVTIPGGTEVEAYGPGDEIVVFVVAQDTAKAGGVLTVQTDLVALEPGIASNDAAGAATSDFAGPPNNAVDHIDLDLPSHDGADEQPLEEWIAELRRRARRLHAVPITPADHADRALETAGVARAFALNRYDPTGPDDDAPFHTTVWALDANGAPVDSATKAAMLADFNGYDRPYALNYHAEDADSLALIVNVLATAKPGADPDALEAAIRTAVLGALDPAAWDYDADAAGLIAVPPTTVLRAFRLSGVIATLPGLQSIEVITINGGSFVDLPAPLTLPNLDPDDLTVTVTS